MTEQELTPTDSPQADLYGATEGIRANEFTSVPAELLEAVLRAEEEYFESRTAAAREVTRAVDSWLSNHPETASVDGEASS